MNIDSAFFLFCFFPLIFILYAAVPRRGFRNGLLTAAGLVFCAFGRIFDLLVLLAVAGVTFLFGLALGEGKRRRRVALTSGVVFNVLTLALFKTLERVAVTVTGGESAMLFLFAQGSPVRLAAPLGVSFFVFKCVSYLADSYKDPKAGTKSFWRFLLYVSFFPQLASGPITRFSDFAPQIDSRELDVSSAANGMKRLIRGLAKKLVIAGAAGGAADAVFALSRGDLDIRLAWLGAVAYAIQLFFDFAGYSDMAIGLGEMFGFATSENFDYPYISASVTEFWRRWHISLSSWLRDYVYIPLGGSRCSKWRTAANKLAVFLLCGVWHGFGLTFLIWGLWHGVLSALEGLCDLRSRQKKAGWRIFGHVYTLLAAVIGFVMFRAETPAQGFAVMGAMFAGFRFTTAGTAALFSILNARSVTLLLLGAALSTPICRRVSQRLRGKWAQAASYLGYAALFVLCVMELAQGGFSPFIYARF